MLAKLLSQDYVAHNTVVTSYEIRVHAAARSRVIYVLAGYVFLANSFKTTSCGREKSTLEPRRISNERSRIINLYKRDIRNEVFSRRKGILSFIQFSMRETAILLNVRQERKRSAWFETHTHTHIHTCPEP